MKQANVQITQLTQRVARYEMEAKIQHDGGPISQNISPNKMSQGPQSSQKSKQHALQNQVMNA